MYYCILLRTKVTHLNSQKSLNKKADNQNCIDRHAHTHKLNYTSKKNM